MSFLTGLVPAGRKDSFMSRLVQPNVENRPVLATICVERETTRDQGRVARIFARVARDSIGNLCTIRYLQGFPVGITLVDRRRQLLIVFDPGEPAPTMQPLPLDLPRAPEGFPPSRPVEKPEFLYGMPCYYRQRTKGNETVEIWYSYEYGAVLRTISKLPGYGITTWRLDEVRLEEPPAELFSEAAILASGPERIRNIWRAAGEFFASTTEEGPEFRRDL